MPGANLTAETLMLIAAFVQRIRERPAHARAMQRGGWSVADHEAYWACLKR